MLTSGILFDGRNIHQATTIAAAVMSRTAHSHFFFLLVTIVTNVCAHKGTKIFSQFAEKNNKRNELNKKVSHGSRVSRLIVAMLSLCIMHCALI